MSRIGKKPIPIPQGVTVIVNDGKVIVKGPKGSLTKNLVSSVTVAVSGDVVECSAPDDRLSRQAWGLMRILIANMIVGVTEGYK